MTTLPDPKHLGDLAFLRAELAALRQQVSTQASRIEQLEALQPAPTLAKLERLERTPASRRRMLKGMAAVAGLMVAGAATATAQAADPTPQPAGGRSGPPMPQSDGNPVLVASIVKPTSANSAPTTIQNPTVPFLSFLMFEVSNKNDITSGLFSITKRIGIVGVVGGEDDKPNDAIRIGVWGQVEPNGTAEGFGYGVLGTALFASTGTGVRGEGFYGGSFKGTSAPLYLENPTALEGPPTGLTITHNAGELYVDKIKSLYYCIETGAPGKWRKIAGKQSAPIGAIFESYPTAGTFHALPQPDRYVDTRSGFGGVTGPVTAGTIYNFALTGRPGLGSGTPASPTGRTIPAGATAVVGIFAVVNPVITAGVGFATLFPGNTPVGPIPPVANLNFVQNNITVSTSFVANISNLGKLNVVVNRPTQFLLDIVGYYL